MKRLSNLIIIMAATSEGVIGYTDALGNERLPFSRLKGDLPRVKRLTTGTSIIVGSKTFNHSPGVFPLPDRQNIVLSRSKERIVKADLHCRSLLEVLALVKANREINYYVFGGAEIYEQFLPYANQCVITIADDDAVNFAVEPVRSIAVDLPLYMEHLDHVKRMDNNTVYLTTFKDSVDNWPFNGVSIDDL